MKYMYVVSPLFISWSLLFHLLAVGGDADGGRMVTDTSMRTIGTVSGISCGIINRWSKALKLVLPRRCILGCIRAGQDGDRGSAYTLALVLYCTYLRWQRIAIAIENIKLESSTRDESVRAWRVYLLAFL